MILTLEVLDVMDPQAESTPVGGGCKVLESSGGTIGRNLDNAWVLPDHAVSGQHARITCRDGVFSIEDTSLNGVFVNGSDDRLGVGQLYPLASGDHIIIGPYKILVSITAAAGADAPVASAGGPSPIAADSPADLLRAQGPRLEQERDPLKALRLDRPSRPEGGPSVDDLRGGLPLDRHFTSPAAKGPPEPPAPPAPDGRIPDGYDPLAPNDPSSVQVVAPPKSATPVKAKSAAQEDRAAADAGLAAVLMGAGLEDVTVTPEFARDLGQILRVVVSGVMDVLRARQHVKDEFKMDQTRLAPRGNNPLKFSVDVDEALHNLLVRRNVAYLEPVEAFEDAFEGVRDHQMAVLEGMQEAFRSMLEEFHPDRLEEQFDGRTKAGPLLRVLNRFRYWGLYRDRFQAMADDPDKCFRTLFGERFAEAFEEQLNRLKRQRRKQQAVNPGAPAPDDPWVH